MRAELGDGNSELADPSNGADLSNGASNGACTVAAADVSVGGALVAAVAAFGFAFDEDFGVGTTAAATVLADPTASYAPFPVWSPGATASVSPLPLSVPGLLCDSRARRF